MKKQKMTLIEKLAITVIVSVIAFIILSFITYGIVGVKLISNPELIGEWFSKLTQGFDS